MLVSDSESGGLVLASASAVRARLLRAAGLSFEIAAANIDEGSVREALLADGDDVSGDDLAEVLARTKATDVAERGLARWTIACDQVLMCEGNVFEKAVNDDDARANLLALCGKTHSLHSAIVLADGREVVWANVDVAHVTLRKFTPQFLGRYMAAAGDAVRRSVGGYELEGLGIQLIDRIDGDYFTVLGLPLYALLSELRMRQLMDA
ncbi:MAG: Maf family protein [Hyphomicrobiaceae bacterium]